MANVAQDLSTLTTDELHATRRELAARGDRLVRRQRMSPGAVGRALGRGRRQPLGYSPTRASQITGLQAEYDRVAAELVARGAL